MSQSMGDFPFQNGGQDTYSSYENPAFKVKIVDIRNTRVEQPNNPNTVDYSKKFDVGQKVAGICIDDSDVVGHGIITEFVTDNVGKIGIIIICTEDNRKLRLDPSTVELMDSPSHPSDMNILGHHDNFYVPGRGKDIGGPIRLMAESRIIKTFEEFKRGM